MQTIATNKEHEKGHTNLCEKPLRAINYRQRRDKSTILELVTKGKQVE